MDMNDDVISLPVPLLKIRPSSGWKPLDLRELWQYRDLLFTLGIRDVKLRYRQTAMGVFWVIAQPLMAAGVFSFVFGKVAHFTGHGVPYFVFSYAGLLGWNAFSNALTKVSASLVGNAQLISKVFFPRMILPLSSVFSTLIDFGVAFVMMLVLLVANRIAVGAALLLLPVWMLLLLMAAVGGGLYASALMVSFRDVQYVLPVLIPLLMYASPVAYAVSDVPERLQLFYTLNPLSGLLEAFRWSLLGGALSPVALAYSAVFSVALFVLGAFAFKRMERLFSDVI